MADKIRIGIIGVGQIGKSHLRKYAEVEGAEVVAAADVNEAEVTRVAEEFGIPGTYTDFRQLLERDDVQAFARRNSISVCTTHTGSPMGTFDEIVVLDEFAHIDKELLRKTVLPTLKTLKPLLMSVTPVQSNWFDRLMADGTLANTSFANRCLKCQEDGS